jgi:hypothetical protein
MQASFLTTLLLSCEMRRQPMPIEAMA